MNNTLNADPAELAKFSDLAHRWWDLDSEFRPLHMINPLRLEWIQSIYPVSGLRAWMWDVAGEFSLIRWHGRVRMF
jgi:2-polyprenyl-6-hydroxyphenyl methylase/3-demethylubiquinone-9 3-methyltransferase